MGNGCVAGDLALQQDARRENILHGSLINEQRRCSGKDPQPSGLSTGGPLAALLLSHRARTLAMLLRRALPAVRQSLAHSFPIYEMGSSPRSTRQISPRAGLGIFFFHLVQHTKTFVSATIAIT